MDNLLNVCMGLGLSAACGFRVFVPLLAMSLAAQSGEISLAPEMEWIGTTPATIAFGVATAVEVLAYYVPVVDNLLDTIEVPAAMIAGTMVTAAVVPDMDPTLRWIFAAIAGGGAAETIELATSATRLVSTATTGGMANSVVSTMEVGSSLVLSLLALAIPALAAIVVGVLIVWGGKKIYKRFGKRNRNQTEDIGETDETMHDE